jgi:outer membrane receptor protein involved in Fe transport
MNSVPSYQMHRASKYLVACLAAVVAVSAPSLRAAASDDMQKLQEENAALRKRLAEVEGQAAAKAPSATTTAAATSGTTANLATDEGVQVLSPFQVSAEKESGYLRTNAVTATRIGTEVQRTPLAIEIKSKDFLDDTNTNTITDLLKYTASGAGDNSFRMARPANGATPVGGFTMRGFQVTSLLRNGVTLYSGWTNNNVDRVEMVMGPAALFFGSGAAGGVINYVTKQPVFSRIPTTLDVQYGSDHKHKVVLDTNQQFSKKAAMRIIGAWEDSGGDRRWEFDHLKEVTASLTLIPFDSGKVKLTFEVQGLQEQFNENRYDEWQPDGWFQAYREAVTAGNGGATTANLLGLETAAGIAAPGSATAAIAYANRIFTNGYGTWGNDMRIATGNYTTPTMTRIVQGALITNASGQIVQDKGFNTTARGAATLLDNKDVYFTAELSPFDWMDFRYTLSALYDRYDSIEGINYANADERTFNSTLSLASAGYYRKIHDHQFDLLLKKDMFGIKNKVLIGGYFREFFQQYMANNTGILGPYYGNIPGASNLVANPPTLTGGALGLVNGIPTNNVGGVAGGAYPAGYLFTAGLNPAQLAGGNALPVNQVIRDRNGLIKTVQQVFTQFDPGFEVAPEVSYLVEINRPALDGYYAQQQAGYINYEGRALNDRLTIMGGVRREMNRDSGQYLTDNFPWFSPPPTVYYDTTNYPPNVYGYDPAYSGDRDGNHSRVAGTSFMAGLSYEVKKDINVYVSTSRIFNRNGATNAGGYSTLNVPLWVAAAQAYKATLPGGLAANPFIYNGMTINTAADMTAALHANHADVLIPPETGRNVEIGVKTSLWDNKLVATASVFHMFRVNRRVDDGTAQAIEPLNGVNNQQFFGPVGFVNPTGNNFINARLLRWRTVGQKDVIEGLDFEATWTPRRNFQMVVNGANLWTAHTVSAPTVNMPGSAAYAASSIQSRTASDIYYGARLENVPKYRLNTWSKYTVTDGPLAGLSLALGTRYSSQTVISRSVDWNPLNGGAQSGDYLVFDTSISYPWELFGYKISTSANISNLGDKAYLDGSSQTYAAGRTLVLHNVLKF